jgi:hypothetical protein
MRSFFLSPLLFSFSFPAVPCMALSGRTQGALRRKAGRVLLPGRLKAQPIIRPPRHGAQVAWKRSLPDSRDGHGAFSPADFAGYVG